MQGRLTDSSYLNTWGFLYLRYEPRFLWWELVLLLRRMGLALLFLIQRNSFIQATCAWVILLAALSLQLLFRPFTSNRVDFLETIGLFLNLFFVFCGILFKIHVTFVDLLAHLLQTTCFMFALLAMLAFGYSVFVDWNSGRITKSQMKHHLYEPLEQIQNSFKRLESDIRRTTDFGVEAMADVLNGELRRPMDPSTIRSNELEAAWSAFLETALLQRQQDSALAGEEGDWHRELVRVFLQFLKSTTPLPKELQELHQTFNPKALSNWATWERGPVGYLMLALLDQIMAEHVSDSTSSSHVSGGNMAQVLWDLCDAVPSVLEWAVVASPADLEHFRQWLNGIVAVQDLRKKDKKKSVSKFLVNIDQANVLHWLALCSTTDQRRLFAAFLERVRAAQPSPGSLSLARQSRLVPYVAPKESNVAENLVLQEPVDDRSEGRPVRDTFFTPEQSKSAISDSHKRSIERRDGGGHGVAVGHDAAKQSGQWGERGLHEGVGVNVNVEDTGDGARGWDLPDLSCLNVEMPSEIDAVELSEGGDVVDALSLVRLPSL